MDKGSSKEVKIFADRPTKNNLVAVNFAYNYGKGTIHRKAYLKIKDIKISINPQNKNLEMVRTTIVQGKHQEVKYSYPKVSINANIQTLKNKKVKWSIVPSKNIDKVVNGNTISLTAKRKGTIKVTAKYRDLKATCTLNVSFRKETVIDNDFRTNNEDYLNVLSDLMDYALEMTDGKVQSANELVFHYMRYGEYDDLKWGCIAKGIDSDAVNMLADKLNNSGYFRKHTYADGYGNKLDMRHLCASINALMYETKDVFNYFTVMSEEQIDLAATTVGDYASGIGNFYAYTVKNKKDYKYSVMKELYMKNIDPFPNMSPTDIFEDIDACLIAKMLKNNTKLTFYDAFVKYYTKEISNAKEKYLSQYSEDEWESNVVNTLVNSTVVSIIRAGAKNVLRDDFKDKDFDNKFYLILFDCAAGFTDFINGIYGGYRK